MADPRFRRVGGTSRNYVDTVTGKQYSRRQYDKLSEKERRAPAKTKERVKKEAAKRAVYVDQIQSRTDMLRKQGVKVQVKHKNGTITERLISRGDVRNQAETKELIRELKKKEVREKYKVGRKKGRDKPRTTEQNKRLKDLLKRMGLREGIPDYVKPGDSGKWLHKQALKAYEL